MDTQNATLDSVEPYSIPPVETLYSRERNGKLYMKHLNAISGWTESRRNIGPLDTHFSRCGSSMVLPIREPSLGGIGGVITKRPYTANHYALPLRKAIPTEYITAGPLQVGEKHSSYERYTVSVLF